MSVAAKIKCTDKQERGEGGSREATLTFTPDYADGRNKEWAAATPGLHLVMTVRGSVADQFEVGQNLTLTFTPEETP